MIDKLKQTNLWLVAERFDYSELHRRLLIAELKAYGLVYEDLQDPAIEKEIGKDLNRR